MDRIIKNKINISTSSPLGPSEYIEDKYSDGGFSVFLHAYIALEIKDIYGISLLDFLNLTNDEVRAMEKEYKLREIERLKLEEEYKEKINNE